jgi:hypothetical protein
LQLALSLLKAPPLDCLITGESAFETLPQTLRQLSDPKDTTLCHLVHYHGADKHV